jgi:signal transduction histidine kinase
VLNVLEKVIQLTGSPPIPNPLGSIAVVDLQNGTPGLIWIFALGALLAAMVGTYLRMRRSTGDLRQQLRWLAYASLVIGVCLVGMIVAGIFFPNTPSGIWDLIIVLGFGIAVPVACGIAILKHGLYDLDLVISKAVVYAVLAAFFTIVYVAVVVGIGSALGSTHNAFLTVLAAALIAIAFNPVRERAKHLANRLVYGDRASPYEVLSEFSDRMAETYSLEDVLPRMARILGEGTGAAEAHVWLRIGEELRPAAAWGDENRAAIPVALADGELPPLGNASRAVAVRDRGDLLGALAVRKPESDPLTPAESRLLDDLAAQAGLVLRNVRLTEELRANLEELQASRQRIVSAQDQERRRLERNIHDGAQQQLVALAVKLRLADGLVEPGRAARARPAGAAPRRRAGRAGEPPRPRARDLSAAPRGPGARGGARRPSAEESRLGHAGVRRHRPLRPGARSGDLLLRPGGAPERREVRVGDLGHHPSRRARRPAHVRGDRRRLGIRSEGDRLRNRAPGHGGPARRAGGRPRGALHARCRNDGRGKRGGPQHRRATG